MLRCFTVVLLLLTTITFAGRPLKSDDAFTLGYNSVQFELASEFFSENNFSSLFFPFTTTYGISNQTDIVFNLTFFSSAGTYKPSSLNCVDLGFKQNIFTINNFLLSIKSGLSSSIENGFTTSPVAFFSLVSTTELNSVNVHLNLGYNQNFSDGENNDLWIASLACELPLSDLLILAAEAGVSRNPSIYCQVPESYSLMGISFNLSDNLVLDAGINVSYQHSTKIDLFTSGLTLIL